MAIESSGVSLSSDFYLSGFYKDNRKARKSSGRSGFSSTELSYEDARALQRAAKKLSSYTLSEDDPESESEKKEMEDFKNAITAFADTYNNAVTSTQKDESSNINRYSKRLKKLADKYSKELEEIGITFQKNGTLKVDSGLLKAASTEDLKAVFSKENSDLLQTTRQIARGLQNNSYNELYSQMTGSGTRLNITL